MLVVLRLLIDTSTWLDLGTRRDGLRWIHALGGLTSIVPWCCSCRRSSSRSSTATGRARRCQSPRACIDRLRQLRRELREYAGDKYEHIWLAETEQHIPLVNSHAPQNFRAIDELLRGGKILRPPARSARGSPAGPRQASAVHLGQEQRGRRGAHRDLRQPDRQAEHR